MVAARNHSELAVALKQPATEDWIDERFSTTTLAQYAEDEAAVFITWWLP